MKKITTWLMVTLYLLLYLLLISSSLGVFYIFRPFKFIDNSKSYLLCQNNNKFFIGPNLVFTFDGLLDSYNDKKARKLCEYSLIRDYADTLKTPPAVNYGFTPVYSQESSWSNTAFAFFLAFSLGAVLIEANFKTVSLLFLAKKQIHEFRSCHSERSEESFANASSETSSEILRRSTPQDDRKCETREILRFTLLIFFAIIAGGILFNFLMKKPAAQIFCQKKVSTMILNFKLSINFTAQSEEEKYVNGFSQKLYQQCLRKEL